MTPSVEADLVASPEPKATTTGGRGASGRTAGTGGGVAPGPVF